MMISDKFLEWVKTAKGTELLRYEPKNDAEKLVIDAEIDKRLEKNVPVILDNIFAFVAEITNEDEK